MRTNSDLNSNLIKSLTSVHLPPPPSAQRAPHQLNQQAQVQQQFSLFNANMARQQQEHQHQQPDHLYGALPVQEQVNSIHMAYEQNQQQNHQEVVIDANRRTSGAMRDFPLPLNTPPHTVSRQYANDPPRKKKVQETPLNHTRSKKNKNLLSPQYSSPTSKALDSSSPIEVTKPPQPSFITTKQQKKAQRALLKQQQQQQQQSQQQQQQRIEAQNKKELPVEEEYDHLPSPRNMPKIVHNSDSKPPFSYATLIGMAILRGEDRKLTLSQIYSWISSTFKYYRKNDVGWQNSIRHNLSLNKAFVKAEKSSDGKGHYWEVHKGYEMQFIKGKSTKRSSLTSSNPPSSSSLKSGIESDPIDSEAENITNQIHRTPKTQIRANNSFEINQGVPERRLSLKKNHTVIGLQHFHRKSTHGSDTEEDYEDGDNDSNYEQDEDDLGLPFPRKKRQLNPVSSIPFSVGSIENNSVFQAPETQSSSGEHLRYGQPNQIISNTMDLVHSSYQSTTSVPYLTLSSPTQASRVSSLSSFSCNTNLETSPPKRQATGPLLEPLTPSSRLTSFSSTTVQPPSSGSSLHLGPQLPTLTKTPLRNSTNTSTGLNTQQNSYVLNFLRTPNTKIKTPNSNSILKRFWNSPSFIDDFYTSPSIPRYSDDDHYKGLFGSPDKPAMSSSNRLNSTPFGSSRLSNLSGGLRGDGGKRQFFESSGQHGFSDLFGIDIVSVVKRAVENEKSSHSTSSSLSSSVSFGDEGKNDVSNAKLKTVIGKKDDLEENSGNSTEYDDVNSN